MSPRILVVDDEESNRTLLGLILERAGYEVVLAADGRSALDLTVQQSISHAFVDVHLPDMRGTTVVQAIRQAHPQAFIVIATMDDNRDTITAAYAADADMFLVKPYNIAKLVNLVPQAARGQRWIMDRLGLRTHHSSN
jgi:CheY-like chemotaxis protein